MNRTVVLLLACIFLTPILGAQESPTPLTIDQAVQTALSSNLNIQAARDEVAAAKAQVGGARSDLWPTVDATGQYTQFSKVPVFTIPPIGGSPAETIAITPKENLVGTIATRLALHSHAGVSMAEDVYDIAVAKLGITETQVALQTRQAYYGALLAQSLVKSAEQSLTAAKDQLKTASDRFDVGTAAKFDVLRAQTQVSESEQNMTEAQNQVQTAQVALNRIVGFPLDRPLSLSEPAPAPQPTEDLPALISTANQHRGEILAAKAQISELDAAIRQRRFDRLPQFALSANYQTVQKENPSQTTGWLFLATATAKLFDGGRAGYDLKRAAALKDEAQVLLQDASRGVEQDVRQAYLNLQTAGQTIETAKARLAQAQEAYDVATVRYQAGVGTATEVADALAALSAARTNLDRATFNYSTSYATLQRALGNIEY